MTQKWYATLRHPKMHPHTKFGIPTSKNIGDMDRTRKRDGRTHGQTHGRTDGRTVRLLYASQSSFGGIKMIVSFIICCLITNCTGLFIRVSNPRINKGNCPVTMLIFGVLCSTMIQWVLITDFIDTCLLTAIL